MLYSKETVTWAVALDKTIVCMGHKTWDTPDWASLYYRNCPVTNCKVLLEGNGKDSRNVRKGEKKKVYASLHYYHKRIERTRETGAGRRKGKHKGESLK